MSTKMLTTASLVVALSMSASSADAQCFGRSGFNGFGNTSVNIGGFGGGGGFRGRLLQRRMGRQGGRSMSGCQIICPQQQQQVQFVPQFVPQFIPIGMNYGGGQYDDDGLDDIEDVTRSLLALQKLADALRDLKDDS